MPKNERWQNGWHRIGLRSSIVSILSKRLNTTIDMCGVVAKCGDPFHVSIKRNEMISLSEINFTSDYQTPVPASGQIPIADILTPEGCSINTNFSSNLDGALWWFGFGYRVIPMIQGQKRPAISYYPWLDNLSVDAIREHWHRHPSNEVGAVLDERQLVLDADGPLADAALERIEKQFGVTPSLIIKTRRGHHHHFRLEEGTFAKPDSHHTEEFPDRLDVRSGKNSIVLTPSRDKSIHLLSTEHRKQMQQVNQDFVDAVFQHNGRSAPRPINPEELELKCSGGNDTSALSDLLKRISPNCGYQDWLNVLMAIYHETSGSAEGFEIADRWSRGGTSYKGRADIEVKWRSFTGDVARPITIATLIARARDGAGIAKPIDNAQFTPCSTTVVARPPIVATAAPVNPLRKYSLIGQSAKYEALAQATTPLLGEICMQGEATVWYAKHNVGKTLMFLHMASDAVEQGRIAAENLYFINADDSSSGIAAKMGLLDEMGAHTLVPGQGGFKAENLENLLKQAVLRARFESHA